MSHTQGAQPRHRSAFAASFLSLIFPGLGHAYAGAYTRAIGFAAAPILTIALAAGIGLRVSVLELAGVALQYLWLIQILNVLILIYRIVAAIDAYRVAVFLNGLEESGGAAARLGRPRTATNPLSLAGLLAVLLVMSGVHVVVAVYDNQAQDLVNCVFDPTGTAQCDSDTPGPSDSANAIASGGPADSPNASNDFTTPPPGATPAPAESISPYAGGVLNILLIGADQRPNQGTFNTDTLLVASVDPKTKQVAMFSLPRDTVGVPLPPGPAANALGTVPCKINSLWNTAQHRPDLFPGTTATRGFQALKDTLGYLYGIKIPYYAEVNFDGFRSVVDAVGGVTINVQSPVLDNYYPGDDGRPIRVYIPAGIQRMTGSQALIYARSRHGIGGVGSNDYDRAARQQRVLLSLKEQTDVNALIPKIPDLVQALKRAIHTDIPIAQLPQMMALAGSVDTSNIRSFVFSPPLYGQTVTVCGESNTINVAKVRALVKNAFTVNPADQAQKDTIATEGASVWVLNGSGQTGQASNLAGYLEFEGINASAPNQKPPATVATTKLVVYNAADQSDPATVAFLEKLLGVQATVTTDPTARVDIVITTSTTTPQLTPPPGP